MSLKSARMPSLKDKLEELEEKEIKEEIKEVLEDVEDVEIKPKIIEKGRRITNKKK